MTDKLDKTKTSEEEEDTTEDEKKKIDKVIDDSKESDSDKSLEDPGIGDFGGKK